MTTEKEKMVRGEFSDPTDAQLDKDRLKAHKLARIFNQTTETEASRWTELLKELFGSTGESIHT